MTDGRLPIQPVSYMQLDNREFYPEDLVRVWERGLLRMLSVNIDIERVCLNVGVIWRDDLSAVKISRGPSRGNVQEQ